MPKIVMSIDLISAEADAVNKRAKNNAAVFFISSPNGNAETADN
jgi:hypothetical protein